MNSDLTSIITKVRQDLSRSRYVDALADLRSTLTKDYSGNQWREITLLLKGMGDLDAALLAARKLCEDDPHDVNAQSLLANVLADLGSMEEAIQWAAQVRDELPDNPAVHYNLGIYLHRVGDFAAAKESFKETLRLDPKHVLALEYLVQLSGDDDVSVMLQQVEGCLSTATDDVAKAACYYAQGNLMERGGRYQKAYEAFSSGAKLMANTTRTDLGRVQHHTSDLIQGFSRDFFQRHAKQSHANSRPIFIVGVPRSGTTLIETILGAHSQVKTGGETKLLRLACMPYNGFALNDLQEAGR